jgi:hypothetical protein
MLRQGGYKVRAIAAVVRGPVVLCVVILLGITGCAADSTGNTSARFSVIHTTAIPKPEIMAYETVLGGGFSAFYRKFGSGTCCTVRSNCCTVNGNGWDYQGPYGQMWTGVETEDPGFIYGGKPNPRVKAIVNMGVHITTARWTVSQADAICNPFLPPDAKYQGPTLVTDAKGGVKGIEKRYTSVLLANTLQASDFTNIKSTTFAPGTFYYMMYSSATYNGSPTMLVKSCVLSTEEYIAQSL